MKFKQTSLDNGLTVIAEINPDAASMAAGFFVRTGSRDETPEVSGVSHFLEHMTFKGTDRRSAFDVSREFDEMGAQSNAFTSEENTVYWGAVLPEFQTRLLDLLADMLRPALRQEDFDIEKNVIKEEIALYEDEPDFRVYEKLMALNFAGHPLGNSILGTPESITAMRREDMQAYFDCRYSPGNVTVAGAGRIDFEAFVDKIAKGCSHWRPFDVNRATPTPTPTPTRELLADEKLTREHIGMMSPAPSRQDEARFAASLLAGIVGDVTGSRLFYALVDPAIADEASMHCHPLDEAGAFFTFISCDPARAQEAVDLAEKELAKFLSDGPTDAELEAAKNKGASALTLRSELPVGRLHPLGLEWVYTGRYMSREATIERICSITKGEVLELARRYDLKATTTLALGPAEKL